MKLKGSILQTSVLELRRSLLAERELSFGGAVTISEAVAGLREAAGRWPEAYEYCSGVADHFREVHKSHDLAVEKKRG